MKSIGLVNNMLFLFRDTETSDLAGETARDVARDVARDEATERAGEIDRLGGSA